MTVFQMMAHLDRTLRELKVPSDEIVCVYLTVYSSDTSVHVSVEMLARIMREVGAVRKKKLSYNDGTLHASFEARSIEWTACKRVDLPTYERIQAVFGGRIAGLPAPAPSEPRLNAPAERTLFALEGGA